MIHPVIDDALKVSTGINNLRGPIQQHLLLQVRPHHTWAEVRQMIDNFFANSYMHLPGQTIGNIDQDVNIIKNNKKWNGKKGKGKAREAKERATTTTTTTTTATTPTTTNNNNNRKKENQKEKVPSGATTTTPARARSVKGDKNNNNNKGKGKSTSSTSTAKCWVCGKLGHRGASCSFNNQKNINNVQQQKLSPQQQQFQLQGASDQPISHMPPEGVATFQLPAATTTTTSASSVTRESTPGPHIYDISSINDMCGCEGGQPFEICLDGYFVAGQSLVTPVLLCRLHLGTSQTTYPFNHTTHNFLFLQLPTNLFTSMATKTSCSSATTSASQSGSTSATSKPRY